MLMWALLVVMLTLQITRADVAWNKPQHHKGPWTVPPYSLNSACASETRELCEVRSPFGEKAIECFEAHRSDLSPDCALWHDARMQCKTQIESSSMEGCPECASFCGRGHSLMHCIRAAGSRLRSMHVDDRCIETDFFRSINRHFKH